MKYAGGLAIQPFTIISSESLWASPVVNDDGKSQLSGQIQLFSEDLMLGLLPDYRDNVVQSDLTDRKGLRQSRPFTKPGFNAGSPSNRSASIG